MSFDPSADFAAITDGLQAVTLEVRGGTSQSIAHAHRSQHQRRESDPAGGKTIASITTWQWPIAESDRPHLGDVIVDADGERYTVVAIAEQVMQSKYSADCRRLSVETGLDSYVDLLQAIWTKNAAGEAVATWSIAATGLRARVQRIADAAEPGHTAAEVRQAFAVILERDMPAALLPVGASLRVRDSLGTVYRAERYEQSERIDTLPRIFCRLVEGDSE